jgi:hypothetical protein
VARIVAATGVPHSPYYPPQFARQPDCETAQLFRKVKGYVDAARADVTIVFANDHFNTFFLDNFPTFALGVSDTTHGPNDNTPMKNYADIRVDVRLAGHIRTQAINSGFDVSVAEEFGIDHAMLVPLHYLTNMDKPMVPIWVNAFVRPLPLARRCFALGQMVRDAIVAWPDDRRVSLISTGAFSLEIGGPRIDLGKRNSVPDPAWSQHVQDLIEDAQLDALLEQSTPEQMWRAGTTGGELLNWIAMLGAIGPRKPDYIAGEVGFGHAYAFWNLDGR